MFSTPLRQSRTSRLWRFLTSAATSSVTLIVAAVIAVAWLCIPNILSGDYAYEVTFQVHVAPEVAADQFELPLGDGGSRVIACRRVSTINSEAKSSLKCAFTSQSLFEATRVLNEHGFVLGNEYRDYSGRPQFPPMQGFAVLLIVTGVLWVIWSRIFGQSLSADLKNAQKLAFSKPHIALMPILSAVAMTFALAAILRFESSTLPQASSVTLGAVLIALAAPAYEEVIFRGYALDFARRFFPWWVASIPSTLGFAVSHYVAGELALITYPTLLALGFGLCWLRYVSTSLTLCVFVHLLYNGLVLALQAQFA